MSHRLVIWSQDNRPPCDPHAIASFDVVTVPTGYEAAAELLAEPALALLVDLSCLTPADARVLAIAKRKGVELLGIGALPSGLAAGQLSGMRLLSVEDVPAALAKAIEADRRARLAPRSNEPETAVDYRPADASQEAHRDL